MKVMENVEAIAIYTDKISVAPKKGDTMDFPRENYDLILEKVERVRDDTTIRERRTIITFEEGMICREKNQIIYCGDNPETIWR